MRARIISILLLSVAPLAGCGSALNVSRSPAGSTSPEEVAGLPFYVKRAACIQESRYLEPRTTITVSIDWVGKDNQATPVSSVSRTLRRGMTQKTKDSLNVLRKLVNTGLLESLTADQTMKLFGHVLWFTQLPALPTDALTTADVDPVANRVFVQPYVDYRWQYFLNASSRAAGAASVAGKLAADGTLTEASAEIEDKTLETVLAAVPTGDVLTSVLVPGVAVPALDVEADGRESRITLKERTHTVVHVLSRSSSLQDSSDVPLCSPNQTLKIADRESYNYRLEMTGDPTGQGKAGGKAISVKGEITLPADKKPSPDGS